MTSHHGVTPAQMGILNHLKQGGDASAKQIASDVGVTPMSIRIHLRALESAGFVEITLERGATGRPTHIYSLTEEARTVFPNDYEALLEGFVRALVELDGKEKVEAVFKRMEMNATILHSPEMENRALAGRVAEMARILSDSGYMAEWQQVGEDTFELTEHNCSILKLATECPEVCTCELSLLGQLLDASVDRKEHIVAGDAVCRYRIQLASRP
jgi:predicted ArsR family transcriptional regulator